MMNGASKVRTVTMPNFDLPASVVGFGCASLGSRVPASRGLDALAEAFDAGVNWFDLAPAYGAGEAEPIFARFARTRRDGILICSKVGLAPPSRNAWLKMAYRIAQPLAGALKGARKAFRRMPSTRNVHVALSGESISHSLESSLSRIGTDRLDVFALHKPSPEDVGRPDVLEAMHRAVRSGKARHAGVSGDALAARAALRYPDVYSVVQLADDPWSDALPTVQREAGDRIAIVTHSVLGVDGALDRLLLQIAAGGEAARRLLRDAGYDQEPPEAAARLLVDRALAANARGVVLLSMFGPRHRLSNLAAAAAPVRPATLALLDALAAQSPPSQALG